MNTNELIEILEKADHNLLEKFMAKNKSEIKIMQNIERNQFDYTWVAKIEEVMEFLDKIVRNPRKFILQEEEIVPIEKAKKISQETIKHLAQHTNLIQDVDEDGTITPSSVLNIHKEESFDIYENRFIKSLLDNLRMFIKQRRAMIHGDSFSKIEQKIDYASETKINSENIRIKLNLETNSYENLTEIAPGGLTVNERIERIEMIIGDYYKSPFMRDLANALPVKSPIRKTNVILKDNNFKKVLTLWEYMERYEVTDVSEKTGEHEVTNEEITKKMDMAFFMDYLILSGMSKENKKYKKTINKYYLRKAIFDFVDENNTTDEKTFKKLVLKEFREAKKMNKKTEQEISKLIQRSIKEHKENIEKAKKYLK